MGSDGEQRRDALGLKGAFVRCTPESGTARLAGPARTGGWHRQEDSMDRRTALSELGRRESHGGG